ncbi:MAG TPA: DUF5134 domain-containing protein [Actinocrinis sp.]|jgi:hypothetical protein|uniref:DUF5134 domain-containing protein n=1 Tax=Actinocrinis sp. TaxID=1920516 RepID=UPI002D46759F|nr:DUF5134 domain-containing protein [Actinocrinis sp.]HZU56419.1 DUF5134 domain-containing protein [Actinocrinis sp.]
MTGTAVSWGLGAALAIVASVAVWRLTRPPARPAAARQRTDSTLHLFMALGMAAMLLPHGEPMAMKIPVAPAIGFGAAAVVLIARGRLHHAVMAGIMTLMMHGERTPVSINASSIDASPAHTMPTGGPMHAGTMRMAMSSAGSGASLLLIAAFCYAAASACVFVCRMSAFAGYGKSDSSRRCAADPLGRGCEITMLISTAVMLLPMI